jgi:hypothetical protein
MQGEERRYDRRPPGRVGERAPHEKHEGSVEDMPQQIFPMHRRRANSEHLAIEDVRQRRERVPVAAVRPGKCPGDCGGPHTQIHEWLIFDVRIVIEVDEATFADAPVGDERDEREQRDDEHGLRTAWLRREKRRCRGRGGLRRGHGRNRAVTCAVVDIFKQAKLLCFHAARQENRGGDARLQRGADAAADL